MLNKGVNEKSRSYDKCFFSFLPTAVCRLPLFPAQDTWLISFLILNLFNIFEISLCVSKSSGTVLVYTFMLDKYNRVSSLNSLSLDLPFLNTLYPLELG